MPSTSRQRADDSIINYNQAYREDFEDLIARIQRASTVRNSVPKEQLKNTVDALSIAASVHGISADDLNILIDVLTVSPSGLNQGTSLQIIKALYPRQKVSEEIVIKVVGCLGHGPQKPSYAVQASILRWLVMVYDILEDYTVLSQLYGVLFNLLDMITLRHGVFVQSPLTSNKSPSCKTFQNTAVFRLQLKRNIGDQPLNALLQVYKNYYPDVIVGDVGPFRSGVFSHPDPEWMQKVLTIQESNAARSSEKHDKKAFKVSRRAGGQISKKRRTGDISVPEVHTFRAIESSVTLEEVQNVDDFVEKLDKLELPSQMAAVLQDGLLQKTLALRPTASASRRLNNWLAAALDDVLRLSQSTVPGTAARNDALLAIIVQYIRSTRILLPAIEDFLKKILQKWDGILNSEHVLELLCFLPIRDFKQLHAEFLDPIEKALISGTEASAARLVVFYAELLRQWAVTHRNPTQQQALTVISLQQHVREVFLNILQYVSGYSVAADSILSFYEGASSLPWEASSLFRIVLPPKTLIYHFIFVGDAMMLSRVCGILSRYKQAFEVSIEHSKDETGGYPRDFVDYFNGFLMDICNLLWRTRAFSKGGPDSKQDTNAMGCTISEGVIEALKAAIHVAGLELRVCFSFSHASSLARFSAEWFRKIEEDANVRIRHAGPITQRTLGALGSNGGLKMTYSDYRVAVLQDLKAKGLVGIWDFMHNTMISLIQKPKSTTTNTRVPSMARATGRS